MTDPALIAEACRSKDLDRTNPGNRAFSTFAGPHGYPTLLTGPSDARWRVVRFVATCKSLTKTMCHRASFSGQAEALHASPTGAPCVPVLKGARSAICKLTMRWLSSAAYSDAAASGKSGHICFRDNRPCKHLCGKTHPQTACDKPGNPIHISLRGSRCLLQVRG